MQDLGPRTWDPARRIQDPRPGTWNLGLKTKGSGPRIQDSKIWDLGTLNFFIEPQNKTFRSKKSLTSKRDNTKYPFTIFPHKDYWIFFLELKYLS